MVYSLPQHKTSALMANAALKVAVKELTFGGHVESLTGTPILSLQSFEKLQFLRVRLWP